MNTFSGNIPTVYGENKKGKFVFKCLKCSKNYLSASKNRKFHIHGLPLDEKEHRVAHCIDDNNYPNGYYISLKN